MVAEHFSVHIKNTARQEEPFGDVETFPRSIFLYEHIMDGSRVDLKI